MADALEDGEEVVVDAVEEEMTKERVMEDVDEVEREVDDEGATGEDVLLDAAEEAIRVALAVVVPLVSQLAYDPVDVLRRGLVVLLVCTVVLVETLGFVCLRPCG